MMVININASHNRETENNNNLNIPNNLKINKKEACFFLKHLNEKNDEFTFLILDEKNKQNNPLTLNGSFEHLYPKLENYNQEGFGVFVTINQTNLKGRKTEDILKVRSVFVDLDGAPLDNILSAPIEPNFIIETSPRRYHIYWLCEDLELENFNKVQESLAIKYNGDPSVKDLPRTMRLPGFYHNKNNPYISKIIQNSCSRSYLADEIFEAFEIVLNKEEKKSQYYDNLDKTIFFLKEKNILIRSSSNNNIHEINCPNADQHSNDKRSAFYSSDWDSFWCFHQHCQHLKTSDFKKLLGISEWPEILPLPNLLLDVLPMTEDMLPEIIKNWVFENAEIMQVPPDYIAVSLIVILSSLLGRKIGIFPKRNEEWKVIPNLWGMLIGRPSLLKTPSMQKSLKVLDILEMENKRDYENQLQLFEIENSLITAQKKSIENSLKNAFSDKKEEVVNRLKQELIELSKNSKDKPFFKRLKTTDTTIEKLGEILIENPQGILLVRDELIGFFKTFNKDGYESARAFYLEAWDGNNSFISDRIGRGTQHIPAICISILGCIQPGPLSFYIYNACNENAGDDGLIQRFQLSVWPDSNSIWKNIDKPINKENKELLFSLIKKISEYSCEDPLNIPCIHFDEEAQIQFNNWLSELENELRNNTLEPYLESHLAKYRSLIPSLALIFEFIFCLNTTSIDPSNVSLNALQMAIQWAKYLRSHAERIYSSQKNYKLESAKNLLNKIKKGSIIEGVSIREVYSHHWSFLTSPNEVKDATEILENHGYIKLEKKGTFGRPSSIIKINPSLFKK